MAFTMIAFSESQDTAGSLTLHAGVADDHVTVDGDDIIVPQLNQLIGYYALGASITQARLSSPSLRRKTLLDIAPLERAAEPGVPPAFINRFFAPIALDPNEALNFLAAEDATGAAQQTGLVWLADGPITPVSGEIFTVRATGSTTLTAYEWTSVALTFGQSLPAGRYQVVGMKAISAGCIAARLIFIGGTWRPGVIGFDAEGDADPPDFRYGNCGVMGEFEHNIPPIAEFLSSSADTSETVYLDLIKVA